MQKIKKGLSIMGVVFGCSMLMLGVNGEAYIDPSVMTYVIQAVAGVAIAVGAAVGIYFRRAKKKVQEKLNIDENHNKEVETDDIVITKENGQEDK